MSCELQAINAHWPCLYCNSVDGSLSRCKTTPTHYTVHANHSCHRPTAAAAAAAGVEMGDVDIFPAITYRHVKYRNTGARSTIILWRKQNQNHNGVLTVLGAYRAARSDHHSHAASRSIPVTTPCSQPLCAGLRSSVTHGINILDEASAASLTHS